MICSTRPCQHGIQQRGQDFDEKFVFKGVHSKDVDRRISHGSVACPLDSRLNHELLNISRKFECLISQGSVESCLR